MTDAALGALAQARERELRAHAAECDACREAFAQAKIACAAVGEGLRALVSAPPSRHFEARLRAKIASESGPARVHQVWPAWVPATAAVLALASALVIAAHISSIRNRPAPVIAPPTQATANPSTTDRPSATDPSATSSAALANRSLRATSRRIARQTEPEVLVEPGQLEAALQFADAVRGGHVDGEKLLAAQESANASLEIKSLEVVPLMPPQFDLPPDSAEDPGGR